MIDIFFPQNTVKIRIKEGIVGQLKNPTIIYGAFDKESNLIDIREFYIEEIKEREIQITIAHHVNETLRRQW